MELCTCHGNYLWKTNGWILAFLKKNIKMVKIEPSTDISRYYQI